LRFENIEYEAERYAIPPSFQRNLDDLVVTLNKYPDLEIEVVGHTDAIGEEAFNKFLSLKRADAAKDYLVEKGIAATRIKTKGMADTQPVAPNVTAEGRQKNRRVEVIFLTK
jgi:outer membrane protein OmpA-like peptidoglycan-associated protein